MLLLLRDKDVIPPLIAEVKDLRSMMDELSLSDCNSLLFHCEAEELSLSAFGAYHIPGYKPLVYTGLQGKSSHSWRISVDTVINASQHSSTALTFTTQV